MRKNLCGSFGWHTAILDSTLSADQKRNLVEDLNQDGLVNRKRPTPEDLQIISNRYALTQAYLEQDYIQQHGVLNAAFREADKDLRNFLLKAAPSAPSPSPTAKQTNSRTAQEGRVGHHGR